MRTDTYDETKYKLVLLEPTTDTIEIGAKAAWVDYTGRDGTQEWNPDTWPDTMLYPDANQFRSAARACFCAMIAADPEPTKEDRR